MVYCIEDVSRQVGGEVLNVAVVGKLKSFLLTPVEQDESKSLVGHEPNVIWKHGDGAMVTHSNLVFYGELQTVNVLAKIPMPVTKDNVSAKGIDRTNDFVWMGRVHPFPIPLLLQGSLSGVSSSGLALTRTGS